MKLLLALLLFLAGCATTSLIHPSEKKIISATELRAILASNNITPLFGISAQDHNYTLIDEKWLSEIYPIYLKKFITKLGVNYEEETFDCEGFSKIAVIYAEMLHYKNPQRKKSTGLAIGQIYYVTRFGFSHAANIIIINSMEIRYFDVQLNSIIELTNKEKESIFNCLF